MLMPESSTHSSTVPVPWAQAGGHSGAETGRFPSIWSWSDWELEEESVEIWSSNSTRMSPRSTGTRERFTRDTGSSLGAFVKERLP